MLLWFRGFGLSPNLGTLNIAKNSRSTSVKQHFSIQNYENRIWGFKDQSNTQLLLQYGQVAHALAMARDGEEREQFELDLTAYSFEGNLKGI